MIQEACPAENLPSRHQPNSLFSFKIHQGKVHYERDQNLSYLWFDGGEEKKLSSREWIRFTFFLEKRMNLYFKKDSTAV